jgi:hypothetical protein
MYHKHRKEAQDGLPHSTILLETQKIYIITSLKRKESDTKDL